MATSMGPEQFKTLSELPEEVRKAAFELIAYAMNTDSQVLNVTLKGLSVEGRSLPDFEISVRRL